MRSDDKINITNNLDWIAVGFYILFVFLGWLNIYAVVYDPEAVSNIFDFSINSGKQLMWIGGAFLLIVAILVIDYKFYSTFSYIFYVLSMLILLATIFIGTEVNGSRSWLDLGIVRVQPAEFAKFTTALALARFLGNINTNIQRLDTMLKAAILLGIPCALILLQNETGGMLVFSAFILVMYREGLPGTLLLIGVFVTLLFVLTLAVGVKPILIGLGILFGLIIAYFLINRLRMTRKQLLNRLSIILLIFAMSVGFVFGVHKIFFEILQEHQRNRIMVLFDTELDIRDVGYHVHQSKIAIGSGDFFGKGFLEGTQTKFDFVPEQSTDFIFCTIGEEHGWFGSTILIILYVLFMMRLVFLAERQKDSFSRIYGYSVASIILFHFMVNIGMTIGLFPVIGIPLPFFSYGGSSLWSFTILLFVFLKLDSHRGQVLAGH
ncbi:rod shape-determining protein RodA [Cytophaga hutchinsonii]|jgi:rod shape determining protein RodA|uniref:Cell wall polymerase n=1 Tax=Cytophaga hutchinsonii (strain ATCC 33406 / DSM 1761 / CIP 103989 / NBRC 15051 / NCIMB 9469 / D465) TaxID=269798 RepID=A0A6N4SVY7_CYTH3|nr:rod shape-determining protein RodA [Cytophaga hutchinsonii]ABG60543.1 rod shape-determining protein [Cytophaga hutchinsonii ATCC 33406]SFX90425.1 rod shape determining protein RodA [Cytophaga hutchinsonii ATCC 33406]